MALRFRVLGSGSSGNATLVEGGGTRLLLDAGLGPRELAERLDSAGVDPASLAALVLSHEHQDHAKGAASFSRRWGVPLWGSRGTYAAAGLGAVDIARYEVLEPFVPKAAGALTVLGIPVPHDAAGPLAFVVAGDGGTLGHATDLGHVNRTLADAFRPCDALLLESNYDTRMLHEGAYPWSLKQRILGPWGHLSNEDVGRFLARGLGELCHTVVLAHLSRKNNDRDLAHQVGTEGLARRGRSEVHLTLAWEDGADWVDVAARPAPPSGRPRQLRLF